MLKSDNTHQINSQRREIYPNGTSSPNPTYNPKTYCAKCGTKEKVVGVAGGRDDGTHFKGNIDNVISPSRSKPAADMHSVVYQLRYLQVAPFAEFLNWPRWIMPDNGGSSAAASEKKQIK
eukprot:g4342.t1